MSVNREEITFVKQTQCITPLSEVKDMSQFI